MSDSFERISRHQSIFLIVDGTELIGTAALSHSEKQEVAPEWERQGFSLVPWTPSVGDRVAFCEDGGGTGEVVEVLQKPASIRVRFDRNGSEETWNTFMFDPLKVQGYEGELEVC